MEKNKNVPNHQAKNKYIYIYNDTWTVMWWCIWLIRYFLWHNSSISKGLRLMPMFKWTITDLTYLSGGWTIPLRNRNIFLEQPFRSSRATDSVGLVMVVMVALVDGSLLIISSLVVVVHLLLALDMLQLPCGSSSLRSQFLARHVRWTNV